MVWCGRPCPLVVWHSVFMANLAFPESWGRSDRRLCPLTSLPCRAERISLPFRAGLYHASLAIRSVSWASLLEPDAVQAAASVGTLDELSIQHFGHGVGRELLQTGTNTSGTNTSKPAAKKTPTPKAPGSAGGPGSPQRADTLPPDTVVTRAPKPPQDASTTSTSATADTETKLSGAAPLAVGCSILMITTIAFL